MYVSPLPILNLKFSLSLYSCSDPVQRIEQCQRGSLFMCSIVQGCNRTYLSQRDLQAHIKHRHMRVSKTGSSRLDRPHPTLASDPPDRFRFPPPPHLAKTHPLIPPPLQGHDTYNHPLPTSPSDLGPSPRPLPPETFRIATVTTRKHSNLITVPIHDDSGSSGPSPHEPHPQTPPGPPPHHHPCDYASQPVVSHPHHIMPPPQQPHYGPPPPPSQHPHAAPAAGLSYTSHGLQPSTSNVNATSTRTHHQPVATLHESPSTWSHSLGQCAPLQSKLNATGPRHS